MINKRINLFLPIFLLCFYASNAQLATKLHINDTRSNDELPNFYDKGIRADFKLRSTINVPGLSNYSTTLTINPWTNLDNSGDKIHQMNFNNGGLFYRNALPLDAQWGAWKQFVLTDVNGNVGIGTATPYTKLEVSGNISTSQGVGGKITLFDNNSAINNRIELFANENGANIGSTYGSGGNGNINFNTVGGVTNMKILQNGNVGIGTTIPVSKLDLGNNFSDPSTFPNKITLWSGGANNYFGMGISNNSYDYFSQGQHRFFVGYNGNPGIEVFTIKASGNAALQGKFESKEIKVTTTPTADFVFEEDYNLPKLEEVEKHIKEKKHLPEIASAKEMEKDGVNVGEFQIKLLQKIEELTLYVIDQNKKINDLEKELKELKSKK